MVKRGLVKLASAVAALTLGGGMAQAVTPVSPYPSPTPKPVPSPTIPSGPQTVFDFSAPCNDCTALGNPTSNIVTGELTLANYTLGQAIDFSNFVSFTYNGSSVVPAFTIFTSNASAIGGAMTQPSGADGFYVSGVQYPGYIFETSAGGMWSLTQQYVIADFGNTNSFVEEGVASPVPEATTWALLILGLGAVGLRARYRHRSRVAARA